MRRKKQERRKFYDRYNKENGKKRDVEGEGEREAVLYFEKIRISSDNF